MKRSVSLQEVCEPNTKKRKFLGLGFLSSLKRVFSKSESDQSSVIPAEAQPVSSFNPDELPSAFTSQKRRLSVHENIHLLNTSVPRTSTVGINGYQALTNTLEAERQMVNGGLEHSRTEMISPTDKFDSSRLLAPYLGLVKDASPSSNIFPRNQVLPTNPLDMELGDDLPIVIEHEFAPLYKDEDGNLVRPPFINLDPRERYNLLQLKKSMEASEFLQNRLKYMVNPDETTSVVRPDNRVDSATQTHDKDYLDRSLKFTNLRTKMALRNRRNRRSNKRGVISGLFYYEPTKKEVEGSTEEELGGYLGKLSKPKFNTPAENQQTKTFADDASSDLLTKRRKSVGQRAGLDESIRLGKLQDGTVDEDYLEKTERISNIIKLKDHSAPAKKTLGPSSGFNFDAELNAISSILQKRKDDDDLVVKSMAADNAPVSSTPLFGDSEKAKNEVEPTEKDLKPAFSFGAKEPAPKISFGAKDPAPKISLGVTEPAPKISFGAKEPTDKFSFGNKDNLPKISFGGAKSSAPAFSLGKDSSSNSKEAPSEDTPEPKRKRTLNEENPSASLPAASSSGLFSSSKESKELPKLSLGAKTDSAPAPAFGLDSSQPGLFSSGANKNPGDGLFGAKPTASTKFSFGEKKDDGKSVSFGQAEKKVDVPKFSFGLSEPPKFLFGEKKDCTAVPKFSFGAKTENVDPPASLGEPKAAPKFSFGSLKDGNPQTPQEPTFSFGKAKETIMAGENKLDEAPKFSFGQANTEAPKLAIGQSKTEDTPKVSFGQADNSKAEPKFVFGEQKPASSSGLFGKSDTKEATPAFSFSSKETTPKPSAGNVVSGFSFGSTPGPAQQQAPASTSFSFGQTAAVDPAQIFGGGGNAPQPAFNFSVSKESTPFKFGAPAAAPVAAKPDGFSFSNNVTAKFGGSRSVTPSGFGFGNGPIAAPAPQFGGFNPGASAPGFNTAPGGTPNAFGVNANANPNANPNQNNGFSFTPNAMGPAMGFNSAPGSFGVASRENTPVAFGQPGSAPGQPFTPPLAMQGRKFAQMRPRKRF